MIMEKEIQDYFNVAKMTESVFEILKDARDDFKDGEIDGFLDDNFDDDCLHEEAEELADIWNRNMRDYLHRKDRRIMGNFCDIDIDYPRQVNGKWGYDGKLVDDLTKRLDEGRDDKQTNADRDWLVDWFFTAFGTFGIRYNFQSEMSEALYCYEMETEP